MIVIRTSFEIFHVYSNGNIHRPNMKYFVPSDKWKFLGIHRRTSSNSSEFLPIENLTREFLEGINMTEQKRENFLFFKNGKGRCRLRDLDHGTIRQWRENIISIRFMEDGK